MPCGCGPEKSCASKPVREHEGPLDEDLIEGESEDDEPTDECRHCGEEIHADAALCPKCNGHDPFANPNNSPPKYALPAFLVGCGMIVIYMLIMTT